MSRILKYYDNSAFEILSNFIKITFKFENTVANASVNVPVNVLESAIIKMIKQNKYITIGRGPPVKLSLAIQSKYI